MARDPQTPPGVLILGCGFTGMVLAARLGFAGTPVWGTTRIDAQTQVLVNGLALPSRVALTQLDALKKDPIRSVIFKGTDYGKPFFYGDKSSTVLDNTGKALEEVFLKGTPVKQSMEDYAKKIRSALKE